MAFIQINFDTDLSGLAEVLGELGEGLLDLFEEALDEIVSIVSSTIRSIPDSLAEEPLAPGEGFQDSVNLLDITLGRYPYVSISPHIQIPIEKEEC